jgi:hypothetical protein
MKRKHDSDNKTLDIDEPNSKIKKLNKFSKKTSKDDIRSNGMSHYHL